MNHLRDLNTTALFNGKTSRMPVEFRNILTKIMEFVAEHEKH